jgi:lactate permease
MIAWPYGRWAAVRHALPLILIISLIHGGGQLALVFWNPVVSNFIAGTVALIALYPLSMWRLYDEAHQEIERPAMTTRESEGAEVEKRTQAEREREAHEPVMGLTMALFPYIVLTFVTLAGLLIPPVEKALGAFKVGLPFPEATTGYGVTNEAETAYSPFALFTHPGSFILIATIISWIVYHMRGYYERWRAVAQPEGIWKGVADGALPASVAVVSFLVMAAIFDHSGQSQVLALGIAQVAPPLAYAFAANMVGVLGAFMTSSNTASNVLFSGMQQNIAELEQLPGSTVIAAQSSGGALGNAIAPANVVLGTGTTGISGREGEVLKLTLPWAAAVALLIGGATVLLAMS